MSNWVAKRQQEAFALYRSYTAMRLHFKDSTGFDYAAYGGKVRSSIESFLEKPEVASRFMKLSIALKDVDNHELFVFVNARYGLDIGYGDIRKCIKQFEEWKTRYGDKMSFVKSAAGNIRSHYFQRGCDTPIDIAMSLLEADSVEALISYLHFYPPLVLEVNTKVEGNAILELKWNNLNKIRTLYYHFGIL